MLAILGATIIDGNGGEPIERGVLLIEGKRIVAVGDASLSIPAHAKSIEARGKYVIPGLMDANVHLIWDIWPINLTRYERRYDELALEAAQVALRNGLTTIFDTWGPREYLIKVRDAVAQGRSVASRVYLAGNIVGLDGPFSADFLPGYREAVSEGFAARTDALWQENVGRALLWMSPEQVRKEIQAYVRRGIDFLKYAVTGHALDALELIQFSPRIQKVIVEEGHRAGLTVQTHTTTGEGLYLAVEAGVDLLQHPDITGPQPIPEETITLIAERGIACAVLARTAKCIVWYSKKAEVQPFFSRYVVADRNVRALLDAGVIPLLTTDGGVVNPDTMTGPHWKNMPPEENLLILGEGHFHWLLAAEQKGMKPMDALLAATRNIARAYEVDRDLGTLEAGKYADLLVLDKNPLESTRHYRSIHLVMKEGQIVDRDSLPSQRLLTA